MDFSLLVTVGNQFFVAQAHSMGNFSNGTYIGGLSDVDVGWQWYLGHDWNWMKR